MYVLGINESHLATAALLKDGEIIACASEERFTRKKMQGGFPFKAVDFCLNFAGINIKDLDLIVFGYTDITGSLIYNKRQQGNRGVLYLSKLKEKIFDNFYVLYKLPATYFVYKAVKFWLHKFVFRIIREFYLSDLDKKLNISRKKVVFLSHHLSHAFAAYYIFAHQGKNALIITNDGSGDNYSGLVFKTKGDDFQEISSTPNDFSLAYLYYYVTKLLGFKPDEEEAKVMGLAGYASPELVGKIYPVLRDLFFVKGLSIVSKIPREIYYSYLKFMLFGYRFDQIAGALQQLTEELTVEQTERAIGTTRIKDVYLGGGLAMNIKANLEISRIKYLNLLQVCPSSGDESTSIGACFWGYRKLCLEGKLKFNPRPLQNLYLGPEFNDRQIEEAVKKLKGRYKLTKLSKADRNKKVARLLADGQIVARFSGRMEFGARALGNRSILADPRNPKVVKEINEQIKGRDFWMPFAPTILNTRAKDYLINPKNLKSPFMMVGFEATKLAQQEITAALHPADLTCRPQILEREASPEYFDLIKEFESITGVGALLNTSFNLHGEPIVCSPQDAIATFKRSGLKFLLIEDFLIQKVDQ